MLTPCPPGPEAQKRSTRMSFSSDRDVHVLGLGQDGHGRRRRVDAAGGLGRRHALDAVRAALVLQARVGRVALDQRRDRLDPADARVVPVHDLDLPAHAFGVALVHAEELAGKERGLVAAGAGPDLEEHVARVVGVPGQQQDLQLLLEGGQALVQRRALGGGHLVELVAGRRGTRQLPGAVELLLDLLVLVDLGDDGLELGQRLLGVAHGAVVLDELRIGQARPDLLVLAADVFQLFEHGAALGRQLPAVGQTDVGRSAARGRRRGRERKWGGAFAPRPRCRRPSSRSASGTARRGRRSPSASAFP